MTRELRKHPLSSAMLPGGSALPEVPSVPCGKGTASCPRDCQHWDFGATQRDQNLLPGQHTVCNGELVGKREEPG